MRKLLTLLSTLVIVSAMLVACAGEETETVVPGTGVATLTDEPMTEEPTLDTPDVTEEPMETPTVDGMGEGTGTPDVGIPVTGEEDPSRVSNLLDYDVWNENGEQIGEVNDMIVDLDNNRVSYIIVGAGGFLEIGERDVLVPWDQMMLQTDTGDENAFIFQGDQQMFDNAPDADVDAILPEQGQPANGWDLDFRNYWQSGVIPGTPDDLGTATADMTGNEAATAMPDMGEDSAMEVQGVVLASELIGTDINVGADGMMNQDREAMGTGTPDATTDMLDTTDDQATNATIDDILVDTDSGEIRFFVLDVAFADGNRFVPVPLDRFQWDNQNGSYILNVDQPTLEGAPSFEDDLYPNTTTDGWDSEYEAYWQ